VGLEREIRGRQAGFRTHMLVCVGSALVMIVSAQVALIPWRPPAGVDLQVDPSRIAYGVMTGVGFLGAGAIVKEGMTIRGLTTAAALWCVAAVGLAAGIGLYVIAGVATALVLVVLWALNLFENYLPKKLFRVIVVRCKWAPGCILKTIDRITKHGVSVYSTSFKRIEDLSTVDISVRIAYTRKLSYATLERELLEADEGFQVISAGEIEN
jgi:putative Mg2+ transporter-C (MgtC) family protein